MFVMWANNKEMKNKRYYRIYVHTGKNVGSHIIKAFSEEDALRIREKFGISNPWGRKRIKCVICNRMDMRDSINKWVMARRRKHIGGSVWYEDNNGQLQQETE